MALLGLRADLRVNRGCGADGSLVACVCVAVWFNLGFTAMENGVHGCVLLNVHCISSPHYRAEREKKKIV